MREDFKTKNKKDNEALIGGSLNFHLHLCDLSIPLGGPLNLLYGFLGNLSLKKTTPILYISFTFSVG